MALFIKDLEQYGFELCEFGGECEKCNKNVHDLFWRKKSHEYMEGEYLCKGCAEKSIEDEEKFYETFDPDWEVNDASNSNS